MWRAVFLSVGISLIVVGLECLFVEQFVVRNIGPPAKPQATANSNPGFQFASFPSQSTQTNQVKSKYRMVPSKEWMPWSLLAAGTVIVIYTFSLPRRSKAED